MILTANSQVELAYHLPKDVYYQIAHTLRAVLPPPITDSPEDLIRRDNAAIAQVASLLPANADEAFIAAQHVAALAWGMACLRLANLPGTDTRLALQCTDRSASMMRQANAARGLLLRVQAVRQKCDNKAYVQAIRTEDCAISLMADALGRPCAAPIARSHTSLVAKPAPRDEPKSAEAGQPAITHPQRASLARFLGGLPAKCGLGPAPPDLVPAFVTGTAPNRSALHTSGKAPTAVAG